MTSHRDTAACPGPGKWATETLRDDISFCQALIAWTCFAWQININWTFLGRSKVSCGLFFHSLLWKIRFLFYYLSNFKIIFCRDAQEHGSNNGKTFGNLSPTGLIASDSGRVSEAQSCHITLASKALFANKTVYKQKWTQRLSYKCAPLLTHNVSLCCHTVHTTGSSYHISTVIETTLSNIFTLCCISA